MAALVLTDAPVATLQQLHALLSAHGLGPEQPVAVATGSGGLSPGALSAGAYDTVLSVANRPGHHTAQLLGLVAAAMKPGARLVVQEPGATADSLAKPLLLSGLTGAASGRDGSVAAAKPAWETGAKAAISLKPRNAAAPARAANGGAAPAPAAKTWVLAADEEEELVDDEELLTEEDKQRPAAPAKDDCEVGAAGRRACENCTCGRAAGGDAAPAPLTREMLDNPTSGCGSCGLGDAFRCGGCPYRGLPAFDMGKKIELPPDFLAVDL